MKRLVYTYDDIRDFSYPVTAADKGLISRIKDWVDKLFGSLDKSLSIIESWGALPDDDDDSSTSAVTQSEDANYTKFQILPEDGVKDWDKSPIFDFTVKFDGRDNDRVNVKLKLTSEDGKSVTDKCTLGVQTENESNDEYVAREQEMLITMGGIMLDKLTDHKYDTVGATRDI